MFAYWLIANALNVMQLWGYLLDRCLRHREGEPDQAPEFHAGAYFV